MGYEIDKIMKVFGIDLKTGKELFEFMGDTGITELFDTEEVKGNIKEDAEDTTTIVLSGDPETMEKLNKVIEEWMEENLDEEDSEENDPVEEDDNKKITEGCLSCDYFSDCFKDIDKEEIIKEAKDAEIEEDESMEEYYAEIGRKLTELLELIL